MDLVLILVAAVAILAYYGFMRSVEIAANIANEEVLLAADVHAVSVITRSARLADKLSDAKLAQAIEVRAKIAAMREARAAGTVPLAIKEQAQAQIAAQEQDPAE